MATAFVLRLRTVHVCACAQWIVDKVNACEGRPLHTLLTYQTYQT